ncbi:hypothetical protein PR003_g25384 [Phytophthora rubi]|uniref:Uncharacterized protein n=1 Tax=Phytophthora rubi TaxID=129364 RepID=A0A6A3HVM6_9STRA|nr:hypothetical protein PR001_g26426 [Phytophthora rubi]KAE9290061.1 hypothetical protein PR003_g25384 [Phytophthora rubi]
MTVSEDGRIIAVGTSASRPVDETEDTGAAGTARRAHSRVDAGRERRVARSVGLRVVRRVPGATEEIRRPIHGQGVRRGYRLGARRSLEYCVVYDIDIEGLPRSELAGTLQ